MIPSLKSAATGRPHFFCRLYPGEQVCIFCGQAREHEWHISHAGCDGIVVIPDESE